MPWVLTHSITMLYRPSILNSVMTSSNPLSYFYLREILDRRVGWLTPVNPTLQRLKEEDCCDLQAILAASVSFYLKTKQTKHYIITFVLRFTQICIEKQRIKQLHNFQYFVCRHLYKKWKLIFLVVNLAILTGKCPMIHKDDPN